MVSLTDRLILVRHHLNLNETVEQMRPVLSTEEKLGRCVDADFGPIQKKKKKKRTQLAQSVSDDNDAENIYK